MLDLQIDASDVGRLAAHVRRCVAALRAPAVLSEGVGTVVEAQTRQRIVAEKTSPEGASWAPWSPAYAATRKAGVHSLLIDTRELVNGLDHAVEDGGFTAVIFSLQEYAGYLQIGTRNMPARPFLGVSVDNASALEQWVAPALESLIFAGGVT